MITLWKVFIASILVSTAFGLWWMAMNHGLYFWILVFVVAVILMVMKTYNEEEYK